MTSVHNQDNAKIELSSLEWVRNVVVGLNLCPFANQVVNSGQLRLCTENSADMATVLATLIQNCDHIIAEGNDDTVLLVLPNGFQVFDDFLDLIEHAQALLEDLELEGVVQIATFHPDYQFEGASFDDPANYTNRSPYPMLHLLQESAVEEAVKSHPDPGSIPQRNIERLRTMNGTELQRLALGQD